MKNIIWTSLLALILEYTISCHNSLSKGKEKLSRGQSTDLSSPLTLGERNQSTDQSWITRQSNFGRRDQFTDQLYLVDWRKGYDGGQISWGILDPRDTSTSRNKSDQLNRDSDTNLISVSHDCHGQRYEHQSQSTVSRNSFGGHGYYGQAERHSRPSLPAYVNRGYDSDTDVSYYRPASIQQHNSQSTVSRNSITDHSYYGPAERYSSPSLSASINRSYVSKSVRNGRESQFTVPICIFRDPKAVPLSCHDLSAIPSPTKILPVKKVGHVYPSPITQVRNQSLLRKKGFF